MIFFNSCFSLSNKIVRYITKRTLGRLRAIIRKKKPEQSSGFTVIAHLCVLRQYDRMYLRL